MHMCLKRFSLMIILNIFFICILLLEYPIKPELEANNTNYYIPCKSLNVALEHPVFGFAGLHFLSMEIPM